MKTLLLIALVVAATFIAHGALVRHLRMDELCSISDAVVLCQEDEIEYHYTNGPLETLVRCKAVRVFKGELVTSSQFLVEYESAFKRTLVEDLNRDVWDGKRFARIEDRKLPAGRALLFLKKRTESESYKVITAKLIQGQEVFQFGQFRSIPGPLVLKHQNPENIDLPRDAKYSEAQLIEDLLIALQKQSS